jgi:hypothetical protein
MPFRVRTHGIEEDAIRERIYRLQDIAIHKLIAEGSIKSSGAVSPVILATLKKNPVMIPLILPAV